MKLLPIIAVLLSSALSLKVQQISSNEDVGLPSRKWIRKWLSLHMFDDMSLSESLGVAFGYVDDDKDGYITKDEMIVALLEYNDTLISDAPESALLNPEAYFTKLFP